MNNANDKESPEPVPTKLSKVGVFVQNINDQVMNIYTEVHKVTNITRDTRLAVRKSIKVRPRALIRSLYAYMKDCKCKELKNEIKSVIFCLEDMVPGGETQLFVCHNKKNLSTQLEFVCGAVKMYREGEEILCDFCLSTYSYSKFVDKALISVGVGMITGSFLFGALAFATGGTGAIVLASLATVAGSAGCGVTGLALDVTLEDNIKDILEASFLHELVSRGHAILQDRKLFINNANVQQDSEVD